MKCLHPSVNSTFLQITLSLPTLHHHHFLATLEDVGDILMKKNNSLFSLPPSSLPPSLSLSFYQSINQSNEKILLPQGWSHCKGCPRSGSHSSSSQIQTSWSALLSVTAPCFPCQIPMVKLLFFPSEWVVKCLVQFPKMHMGLNSILFLSLRRSMQNARTNSEIHHPTSLSPRGILYLLPACTLLTFGNVEFFCYNVKT